MTATIVEIGLPADEFALSRTLSELEAVEFEVERFVAQDTDQVMPFVWASGDDVDRIADVLKRDESIEGFELLSEFDDEQLYRMEWIEQIQTLVQILVEEDGSILAAFGDASGWELRVLFSDRDSLSRTYDYCQEAGLTMDVHSIYRLDDGREGRFGLTDEHRTRSSPPTIGGTSTSRGRSPSRTSPRTSASHIRPSRSGSGEGRKASSKTRWSSATTGTGGSYRSRAYSTTSAPSRTSCASLSMTSSGLSVAGVGPTTTYQRTI